MAIITTWSDVEALSGGPTTAERALRGACAKGKPCELGTRVPKAPTSGKRIRAEVLRYFILGGCADAPVYGAGVEVLGGWIDGALDLDHQVVRHRIKLIGCRFSAPTDATNARLCDVFLNRSRNVAVVLQGATVENFLCFDGVDFSAGEALDAPRCHVRGGVFMNDVRCPGSVSFIGAKIGGQFAAICSHFTCNRRTALSLQEAEIDGVVALEKSKVHGRLDLSGAKIRTFAAKDSCFSYESGYSLDADSAKFDRSVFLDGSYFAAWVAFKDARIGGQFSAQGTQLTSRKGCALSLRNARIESGLFFGGKTKLNLADMSFARTNMLTDHRSIWPADGDFNLNGFVYDRVDEKKADLNARIDWLERGSHREGQFYPQPYTQFAKVMRDAGNETEARHVLFHRDRLLGRQALKRRRVLTGKSPHALYRAWRYLLWGGGTVWDGLLRFVVGYGHKPFRSLGALLFIFAIAFVLAQGAWNGANSRPPRTSS